MRVVLQAGSWSLSFWLKVLEAPTPGFRTLFYKGDGQQQRTPSAWFLPNEHRLTIRASVEGAPDVGAYVRVMPPAWGWLLRRGVMYLVSWRREDVGLPQV